MARRGGQLRALVSGAVLASAAVVGVALHEQPPREADALAVDLDRRLRDDVAPLLSRYCLDCHQGEDAEAGVRLDRLTDVDAAVGGVIDVRTLREMVGTAAMPPKRKRQPTEHERLIITQWADSVLAYVPPDAPIDPGWFTIHRLNRAEYRNTLRDLLGIDPSTVDLAAKLPRDDTGYGFDNVADVLSVSPLAVEQYLSAAERAIETALGPLVEFGDRPETLRPLEGTHGQPTPRGGFLMYSNGRVSGTYEAPLTGEYLVRVSAWETHAGDENSRLGLRVGLRRVEEFDVSAVKGSPQELRARVRLSRGAHTISAHFLNDYYVANVADRNLAIESISVAGPLEESTADRPPAWTSVFAPGAGTAEETARARAVLGAFASRAYRRPATQPQVDGLMRVYQGERAAGRGFEPAVRTALSAVLVSPNFLFRSVAPPDAADPAARYSLDGYELASRLSYFLWSSMPDGPLLDAAADGSLLGDQALAAQVRRMLGDAKAGAFVENFSGQWLQLRALEGLAIDRGLFPDFDDGLRSAMLSEASLFFLDVLRSDRSVLEFIDCRETFLNSRLASFYGVPGVEGDEFRRVRLPDGSPRGGVLTMGAVLTLTSHTTRTSPVKRGLFVLDQILGAPPPPPPADVPPLEQAAHETAGATVRERLAAHVANPTCAACHNRLDPLGLAFENFDAIGRWRDAENGRPIDASGTLPGGETLTGAPDLKRVLAGRADQFVEALSAKVLTYALGRGVEPFDRPAVRRIARRTREHQDRFSALVESVALSETFRTCRGRSPRHD